MPAGKLLLPPQQAFVTGGHQHDHDGVGARKNARPCSWEQVAPFPAAFLHRGAGSAIGAGSHGAGASPPSISPSRSPRAGRAAPRPCMAMPRKFGHGGIVAGQQFFHRRGCDAHAEDGRAVPQAQEDRAGIGAEFQRFIDGQQRGAVPQPPASPPASRDTPHRRGAVAAPFQREQFSRRCRADCAARSRICVTKSRLPPTEMNRMLSWSSQPSQILRRRRADEVLNFLGILRQRWHHPPDRTRPGRRRRRCGERSRGTCSCGTRLPSAAMFSLSHLVISFSEGARPGKSPSSIAPVRPRRGR